MTAFISLIIVSCSGPVNSKNSTITVRFSPEKAIESSARVAASEVSWKKTQFTILQNDEKIIHTIENTGTGEIVFTHTAPVGALLKITADVFQDLYGEDVAAFRGESDRFAVTAGQNAVTIRTVYRIGRLRVTAGMGEGEGMEPPTAWRRAELLIDGRVRATRENNAGEYEYPVPPVFEYLAEQGEHTVGVRLYDVLSFDDPEYFYEDEICLLKSEKKVTVAAGLNQVMLSLECALRPVTVFYSVPTVEPPLSVGVIVTLNGKNYCAKASEDIVPGDSIKEITFDAPVDAVLSIEPVLRVQKQFPLDITDSAVPEFFSDRITYTVRESENTHIEINPQQKIPMTYVLIGLNNGVDISNIRSDVFFYPVEINTSEGYIFCFHRKDSETLESIGLLESDFTGVILLATWDLPDGFGPWDYTTFFNKTAGSELVETYLILQNNYS